MSVRPKPASTIKNRSEIELVDDFIAEINAILDEPWTRTERDLGREFNIFTIAQKYYAGDMCRTAAIEVMSLFEEAGWKTTLRRGRDALFLPTTY